MDVEWRPRKPSSVLRPLSFLKDDATIEIMLDNFTLPQIMSFIDLAAENNCVNVQAVLLNYRNEHYPEYDGFAALDALLLDDDF